MSLPCTFQLAHYLYAVKSDWSQFDAKTGLIFMAGLLLVFNAMGGSEFAWFAAGTSALLAWVTILLRKFTRY